MAFLTPLALIGFTLAVPVVLLYMLRLRRREVPVSSTFLWQQLLQDREANAPWQKLKRNLLLFLQLLILALMVFALARPFLIVPAVSAGQVTLLLDASASMNALEPDGQTRFALAQAQALQIVDTLGEGSTMRVIRVGEVPEPLTPDNTGDRAVLRAAIESAQPGAAQADWTAALTLAAADAAGAEDFTVVIVSDGGLGETAGLPGIPGTVRYVPVGSTASNLAITALSTRALPGQPPQTFAQITNYGGQDAEIIFDLRVDGELFSAERYTVPAQANLAIVTEDLPEGFTTLQAGLTLPAASALEDALALDNTAWAVYGGAAAGRALVMTEGNIFVEQVLRSLQTVTAFKGDTAAGLPDEAFDLYIFDGWLPETLPDGDILFINPPQSTALFTLGGEVTETSNPVIRRDDPRTTFLDFDDVSVRAFRAVSAGWADALVTVDGGPLVLAGEVDGRQVAMLPFDLRDTDLPLQVTWPVLMNNLLTWFTPRSAINTPDGLRVGETLAINPPFEADAVTVTLPDSSTRTLATGRETLVFADTTLPGLYTLNVNAGTRTLQSAQFAVNLFSPLESDLTPRTSIILGTETVSVSTREETGQQEFWPWLALLALIVLLAEWFAYHRSLRLPDVRMGQRFTRRART